MLTFSVSSLIILAGLEELPPRSAFRSTLLEQIEYLRTELEQGKEEIQQATVRPVETRLDMSMLAPYALVSRDNGYECSELKHRARMSVRGFLM
jgi:hypothetical protein